eukprot:gnl/TRDRNA2_/TRDRNA2_174732_c2_seq1.p1 gnl/TRDRNA2_/TRDRNA2_174732_c2~~gnl/TRDRNA2_/TRDRNA2_174732_c2_seq1.p1  ORF type:complete len:706 (-),score=103.72 gnl/TRDRNA2_/TRDRNA2_174732_c2_seq1:420-2537(-)
MTRQCRQRPKAVARKNALQHLQQTRSAVSTVLLSDAAEHSASPSSNVADASHSFEGNACPGDLTSNQAANVILSSAPPAQTSRTAPAMPEALSMATEERKRLRISTRGGFFTALCTKTLSVPTAAQRSGEKKCREKFSSGISSTVSTTSPPDNLEDSFTSSIDVPEASHSALVTQCQEPSAMEADYESEMLPLSGSGSQHASSAVSAIWLSDSIREVLMSQGGQNFQVIHAGVRSPHRMPYILHLEAEPCMLSLAEYVVPAAAECLLVLIEPEPSRPSDADLVALFDKLWITSLQSPPVIAVLLKVISDSRDIEAQKRQLVKLGANDVIVHTEDAFELSLRLHEALEATKKRMRQLATDQLISEPDEFWEMVDLHINGFHRLDSAEVGYPRVGNVIGNRRKIISRLGSGRFGTVFLCKHMETEELQAVKVVDKRSLTDIEEVERSLAEMTIQEQMTHPNIVRAYGVKHTQGQLRILMAYAGPFHMAAVLSPTSIDAVEPWWAREVFFQIASAVDYLHCRDVAHRDIKPENVMMSMTDIHPGKASTPIAKLGDFGLATRTSSSSLCTCSTGTMPFLAPEVLRSLRHDATAADVWSLGVLLLELLIGTNALPAALGWRSSAGPAVKEKAVEQLEDLFADASVFLQTLKGWRLFQKTDDLDDILKGMFKLSTVHRWSVQTVLTQLPQSFRMQGQVSACKQDANSCRNK